MIIKSENTSLTLGKKSAAIIINDDGTIKIITTGDNPAAVIAEMMKRLVED